VHFVQILRHGVVQTGCGRSGVSSSYPRRLLRLALAGLRATPGRILAGKGTIPDGSSITAGVPAIVSAALPEARVGKVCRTARGAVRQTQASDDNLHLHVADLNDVIRRQRPLRPGINAATVDIGAVGTVWKILDLQIGALEADAGVLPRAPDSIGRLLIFQIDINRLVIGPADEVQAFRRSDTHIPFLAAQDHQGGLGARRQSDGR